MQITEQLGQDVGLGFPLHDTNGFTLKETACFLKSALQIGLDWKGIISIKIL